MDIVINTEPNGLFNLSYDAVKYMADCGSEHALYDLEYHEKHDKQLLLAANEGFDARATAIYTGETDKTLPYLRHDPYLVKAVKDLGDAASGMLSNLKVVYIPLNTRYYVDSYDGKETVRC